MRILFVMYNMEIGGTRKSLLNLLSYLEKYEVEVDLLLFSPFGIFMNEIPEYVNIIKGNLAMQSEYYGAAEPPVRCGESHLSGLTEPPHFVY